MITGRWDRAGGILTIEIFFIIAVEVHAPNYFASFNFRVTVCSFKRKNLGSINILATVTKEGASSYALF
jgi:hypothetical protein